MESFMWFRLTWLQQQRPCSLPWRVILALLHSYHVGFFVILWHKWFSLELLGISVLSEDIRDLLSSNESFTVFAPSDKVLSSLSDSLIKDIKDRRGCASGRSRNLIPLQSELIYYFIWKWHVLFKYEWYSGGLESFLEGPKVRVVNQNGSWSSESLTIYKAHTSIKGSGRYVVLRLIAPLPSPSALFRLHENGAEKKCSHGICMYTTCSVLGSNWATRPRLCSTGGMRLTEGKLGIVTEYKPSDYGQVMERPSVYPR